MAPIDELKKSIAQGRTFVVAGAGVSIATTDNAAVASWKGLIRNGLQRCVEIGRRKEEWLDLKLKLLDISETSDLVGLGNDVQSIMTANGDISQFAKWLRETIGSLEISRTDVIESLINLNCPIATTNYDRLLEQQSHLSPITWKDPGRLHRIIRADEKGIVHLHGYYEQPASVILGIVDYQTLVTDPSAQAMQQLLAGSYSLLLAGFGSGLDDPNFTKLISWLTSAFKNIEHRHFQLVKVGQLEDVRIAELQGAHIDIIEYGQTYEELPHFLRSLAVPRRVSSSHNPPQYPDVGRLPLLDIDAPYVNNFVGRLVQLDDVRSALESLSVRSDSVNRHPVQLIWLYGFGGLGKSWFLRRSCVESMKNHSLVRVAFIDWDSHAFRRPLSYPPTNTLEMFDAIAYRLAQIFSKASLSEYWKARENVVRHRQLYSDLIFQFDTAASELTKQSIARDSSQSNRDQIAVTPDRQLERGADALRRVMNQLGFAAEKNKEIQQFKAKIASEISFRLQAFQMWGEQFLSDADVSVIRPNESLSNALEYTLVGLSLEQPIFLVIDTCELLSEELDFWLRRFLAGVLANTRRCLVLIGSRLQPDAGAISGAKDTWLAEIPNHRVIAFNETLRFNFQEITQVLARVSRPLPAVPDLAVRITRVTLGIPLAVSVVMEMHESGDEILKELATLEDVNELLDQTEASRLVTEAITSRWLKHFERSPESRSDLADIQALALLTTYAPKVLRRLWAPSNPLARRRQLSQRYSLLSNGELHESVRTLLRRQWRVQRPDDITHLAGRLSEILREYEPQISSKKPNLDWSLEYLNLYSWHTPEGFVDIFARIFPIAAVYDERLDELKQLISELPDSTHGVAELRSALKAYRGIARTAYHSSLYQFLEARRNSAQPLEWACLDLMRALSRSASGSAVTLAGPEKIKFERDICALFERCLTQFSEFLPRRSEVISRYMEAAFDATIDSEQTDIAQRAHDWCRAQGVSTDGHWFWMGNLHHNLGKYEDALADYKRFLEEDDKSESYPAVYRCMAHVLTDHLKHYPEALIFARQAVEHEPWNYAPYDILVRVQLELKMFDDAAESIKRAKRFVAFDFAEGLPDSQEASNLLGLEIRLAVLDPIRNKSADSLIEHFAEQEHTYEEWNSVSWLLYRNRVHLPYALEFSRKAVSMTDKAHVLHTYVSVLAAANNFQEMKAPLTKLCKTRYLNRVIWEGDEGLKEIIQDMLPIHARDILGFIDSNKLQGQWLMLRSAIDALTNNVPLSVVGLDEQQRIIAEFYWQELKPRFSFSSPDRRPSGK